MRVWPGKPYPLGASWDAAGVNFAIFSEEASKVELCLFDDAEDPKETIRIPMPEHTHHVWHCYLPDARPGQLYGYRVHGAYAPEEGLRFNPHKILFDPYAKAVGRELRWGDEMFPYRIGSEREELEMDDRDNAAFAPLAMVIDPAFTWGDDRPPRTPWHETIIYEMHVRGFSMRHPEVPEELRGTFAAMATEPILRHLTDLGITAVEIMPVHYHVDDRVLIQRGLSNYWGYNTLGFFAPHPAYYADRSQRAAADEFKTMVRSFHSVGIEVILDVVYNHTAEGNHMGPSLSFRGIDNRNYYRLTEDPRYYQDFTGCGNTLNMRHPRVLQLIMDSLRYWVVEMHVDGFRFDLASALARELFEVDRLSAFFDLILQDPVLSQVKLIAEPWDVGEGGYQVGNFPPQWTEWNGKYRDVVRGFWRGDEGLLSTFTTRLCGSSDLYEHDGRRPYASINFVTCHDGFTLQDLVSYENKHNEANGEDNQDGSDDNQSWNCGVEGESQDPGVLACREKQKRNLMATLLLSQGVPMILSGDEIGHTQKGNNNAYCQDNELTWIDWEPREDREAFLEFVQSMIRFRKAEPALHRRSFFQGRAFRAPDVRDVIWLEPSGEEMSDQAFDTGFARCFGVRWHGTTGEVDARGEPVNGDTVLMLFNAHDEEIPFHMPEGNWDLHADTAKSVHGKEDPEEEVAPGAVYPLAGKALAVFVEPMDEERT